MSSIVIPNLMDQLESLSKYSIAEERAVRILGLVPLSPTDRICIQTLLTVVSELDKTLFDDLVKSKSAKLSGIMRQGILESGVDWYETPRPTGSSKSCDANIFFLSHIDHRCPEIYVRGINVPR
jgi:exocyst complex component 2